MKGYDDTEYSKALVIVTRANSTEDPIGDMVELGVSVEEIAKTFDVNDRTIRKWRLNMPADRKRDVAKLLAFHLVKQESTRETMIHAPWPDGSTAADRFSYRQLNDAEAEQFQKLIYSTEWKDWANRYLQQLLDKTQEVWIAVEDRERARYKQ